MSKGQTLQEPFLNALRKEKPLCHHVWSRCPCLMSSPNNWQNYNLQTSLTKTLDSAFV